MKQCPECKKFKKADNCIRCYQEQKKKSAALEMEVGFLMEIIGEVNQAIEKNSYREQGMAVKKVLEDHNILMLAEIPKISVE